MNREVFSALLDSRRAKRPAVLITWLQTGRQTLVSADAEPLAGDRQAPDHALIEAAAEVLREDRSRTAETAEGAVFIQAFNPALRMIIVGAVHISQTLAPMASLLGYEVCVIDPRRAFASSERFPEVEVVTDWPDEALEALSLDRRSAVVTLTHDPKLDDPALAVALRSEAFYIASLGSQRTHVARIERLRQMGFGDGELARIHGPAGLPIGARSPAEIATAILAQATAVLHGAGG